MVIFFLYYPKSQLSAYVNNKNDINNPQHFPLVTILMLFTIK